jgi:DDE family transposase
VPQENQALPGQPLKKGFRAPLTLEHGAPSHDTFSRLFRLLDAEQFRHCFQRFMAGFAEACQGVVAIDGKEVTR